MKIPSRRRQLRLRGGVDEQLGTSACDRHASVLLGVVVGVIVFMVLVVAGLWLAGQGWLWLQSLD